MSGQLALNMKRNLPAARQMMPNTSCIDTASPVLSPEKPNPTSYLCIPDLLRAELHTYNSPAISHHPSLHPTPDHAGLLVSHFSVLLLHFTLTHLILA